MTKEANINVIVDGDSVTIKFTLVNAPSDRVVKVAKELLFGILDAIDMQYPPMTVFEPDPEN